MKDNSRGLAEFLILKILGIFPPIQLNALLLSAVLPAMLFIGVQGAEAANRYVRAGATGANNGSDWSNAFTALPPSLVRGDTYYIADGVYSGKTLNTANSGTTPITLKKATIADHGTSTGWSDIFGDGQAEFRSGFDFSTSYWVIDGVTGGGPAQWESNFGFFVNLPVSGSSQIHAFGITGASVTSITVQHVDVKGRGRAYASAITDLFYITSGVTTLNIRYCLLRDVDRTMILTWPATVNGVLIEYTKFARNGNAEHREAWSAGVDDNVVVRYNLFEDILGTGVIALVNGTGDATNWDIYGNIIYWTGNFLDGIINTGILFNSWNGTDTFIRAVNWRVYNNIIANIRNGSFTAAVKSEQALNYVVENNIWYNNTPNETGAVGVTTADYNWFFANGANGKSGAHDVIGSSNPFVNSQPWLTGNWGLKVGIAGLNVGTAFNVDMLDTTRGADGVWDRGAIEFGSGIDNIPPQVPTNVRVQ